MERILTTLAMASDSQPPGKPGKKNDQIDIEKQRTQSQALPDVEISEILGFLEVLKSKGGKADIYHLAGELNMEFGDTLNVVRAAELLGFVHTPGGDVVLEEVGIQVTKAKMNTKKSMIKDQIKAIPVFQSLLSFLQGMENHEAEKDMILEKLAELLPNENAEESFSKLVDWGRYAEIFGYNDDTEMFYLDSQN